MGWTGGGGSAPAAPDYTGLTRMNYETANRLLAQQTEANRPNQQTPWGSSTWTQTPTGGDFNRKGYRKAMERYRASGVWTPTPIPGADGSGYQPGGSGNAGVGDSGVGGGSGNSVGGSNGAGANSDGSVGDSDGGAVGADGANGDGTGGSVGDGSGGGVSASQINTPPPGGSGSYVYSRPKPKKSNFTSPEGVQWSQNIALNPAEQRQLDRQRRITGGLGREAEGLLGSARRAMRNPLSTEGLPQWTGYNTHNLQNVDPNAVRNGLGNLNGSVNSRRDAMGQMHPGQLDEFGNIPRGGRFRMGARGNSKDVQDATYQLLSPQRQMERDGEIQRLKNQGLTEDSPAFQRAMERLDQGDTDAQLKSLLAGRTEYANQFSRGLNRNQQNFSQRMGSSQATNAQRAQQFAEQGFQAQFDNQSQAQLFGQDFQNANLNNSVNQQRFGQNLQQQNLAALLRSQQFGEQGSIAALNNSQRGQMLQERQLLRQAPLNDMRMLMGQTVTNPSFGNFLPAQGQQPPDYMNAAQLQYQAQMNNYNAQQAQSGGMMQGLGTVAGGLIGAYYGGPVGASAGASIGGAAGGYLGS